jgi:two-component sensor histidine kinase/HAMP domain-containing protein
VRAGQKISLILYATAGLSLLGLVRVLDVSHDIRREAAAAASARRELERADALLLGLEQLNGALREALLQRVEPSPAAHAEVVERIEQQLAALARELAGARSETGAALAVAERTSAPARNAAERSELQRLIAPLERELAVHRGLVGELLKLLASDPDRALAFARQRHEPHHRNVVAALARSYRDNAEREFDVAMAALEARLARSVRSALISGAVLLATALGFALLLGFGVARPLRELREAALAIAAGDRDARLPLASDGDFGAVAAAFHRVVEQLKANESARSFVNDVVDSMREMIFVTTVQGRILGVNPAVERELGWSAAGLTGRRIGELLRPTGVDGEYTGVASDGREIPLLCAVTDAHDEHGAVQARVWGARDIAPQKRVEERLRDSLADKEVLLHELHHRVKNNLQIVSSLLRLQGSGRNDPEARAAFQEAEARVRSIALVHEQLCKSAELARIDFRAYVEELARNVSASFAGISQQVKLSLGVEPVTLDLDRAIPCGLILNELLANAYKHAFEPGAAGTISVSFRCGAGRAELLVADDGAGFDPNAAPEALGLRLVRALAGQLGGELAIEPGAVGTRARVCFSVPADAEVLA